MKSKWYSTFIRGWSGLNLEPFFDVQIYVPSVFNWFIHPDPFTAGKLNAHCSAYSSANYLRAYGFKSSPKKGFSHLLTNIESM